MDVSYSAWRHAREESMVLKGESFSFLFDRRYTNRLNRMSRVFFEAYIKATKELASQEDRFPSLSEIDARMERGAVYAFKDRLMKSTEFFEEVKISGISYLVPKASRFIDSSGTYTDLILNFDEGTGVLPTRRKIPAVEEEQAIPATEEAESQEGKAETYPAHIPEPYAGIEEDVAEAKDLEEPEPITKPAEYPPKGEVPEKKVGEPSQPEDGNATSKKKRIIIIALIVLAILLAAGAYMLIKPVGTPVLVKCSAYLSNESNYTYLGLDINNREGIINELEMVLPPNIDRSISARGGIVSIAHAPNTLVRLNSSSDASIRIYLSYNWTTVPVTFNLEVPKGFDSSLVVHGKNYDVKRKDDTIILRFDLSREGVDFEQSFTRRR